MFFNNLCKNFETRKIDTDSLIKVPIEAANFGILTLNVVSCGISEKEQDFVFTIDQSGSMSDICSDGRSKMQHIIHTLKNMISYFHDNQIINLHITVFAFDDNFATVIERTQVSDTNLKEILTKVDGIQPKGGTNIEIALKETGKYITRVRTENPLHNISHIFMTDGEATVGNKNADVLKGLVDPSIENAFIGFGSNHDSTLLTHISDYRNSSYHFIDALEKAGLVYGEILHGILYKYLTDVQVTVENGLVYDFKTNQWIDKLFIGDIAGESDKTYHLISNTPDSCNVILSCKNLGEEYFFAVCQLVNQESNHTKYVYRQKTLELLFELSNLQKNKMGTQNPYDYFHHLSLSMQECDDYTSKMERIKVEVKVLKQKLREFFEQIKKYMSDNNLNDDSFLKNLCDDIYISHKTLGTTYGAMYATARQTSQGTQRCYTVSATPRDDEESVPTLFRSPMKNNRFNKPKNLFSDCNISLQNPDDLIHNLSSFDNAPYLTPTATRLMREVSSNRNQIIMDQIEEYEEESQLI
jgi:Mg-chelatase subunit ChlD